MTRRMTTKAHITAIKARDAITRRLRDADNDRGAGALEYVLLAVLGIVVVGLIAVAVTNFVNAEIAKF